MQFILIFLAKTIENILTTIRIIVLSNQKKLIGAILNVLTAIIWIYSTVAVIDNISNEPLKILAYALGCFVGSYAGCLIEEQLAIGDNMITCITEDDNKIVNKLRELNYKVTTIDGYGIEDKKKVLLIMTSRKKNYRLSRLIKRLDKTATIISENATTIYFDKK